MAFEIFTLLTKYTMKKPINNDSFDWNVIFTEPDMEKKISSRLTAKRIKNYLPLKKVEAPWWSFKRYNTHPLFPSIIFVKPTPSRAAEIRQIDGVINFLYWLNKPALIRSHEITTIKVFLNTHKNISIEKIPVNLKYVSNIHDHKIIEMDKLIYSDNFKVEIPTLGYALVAESANDNIRYIKTVKQNEVVALANRLSNAG